MSASWTPELIVELVRVVIWPVSLILLFIAVRFVFRFPLSNFFSKNTLAELAATTTGVVLKFNQAPVQQLDIKDSALSDKFTEGADIDLIKKVLDQNSTEYSKENYKILKKHFETSGITEEDKVDLLAKDLSITRSINLYLTINNLIFRSQFDLLSKIFDYGPAPLPDARVYAHFLEIKELHQSTYKDWGFEKYISFLVASGIIEKTKEDYLISGYFLTQFGSSYIVYMRKNWQLVDRLCLI